MDSASYSPIMPSQAISYVTNNSDQISITKLEHEYPTFVPAKMVNILYALKVSESWTRSIREKIIHSLKLIDEQQTNKGLSLIVTKAIEGTLLKVSADCASMSINLSSAIKYKKSDCSKDWTMRELKEFFNSIPEKDLDNKIDESVLRLLFSL